MLVFILKLPQHNILRSSSKPFGLNRMTAWNGYLFLSFLKHHILWWLALCLRVLCNLSETSNQVVLCSPTLEQPMPVWGNWGLPLVPTLLSVTFNWWWEISRGSIYTSEIMESHKSEAPCGPRAQSINVYQCTTVKWFKGKEDSEKKVPHKEYVFPSTLYFPCLLQCVGHGHWTSVREIQI